MRRAAWSVAFLLPAVAASQTAVILSGPPECRSCQLRFEKVVTLGKSTDAELIADWPTVQSGPRGEFYVSGSSPRSKFLVFGKNGEFLRAVGREGSGPNEFRFVVRLSSLPGDSIVVVDAGNRRLSVLGIDGQVTRSLATPFQVIDLAATRAGLIVSGPTKGADGSLRPVHLLATDGRVVRSFGDPIVGASESALNTAQRAIAADKSGGVWMAPFHRYEIDYASLDGKRSLSFERTAEWFPSRTTTGSRRTWQDPLTPRIRDIYSGPDGLLWVMAVVPKRDWKPTQDNFGAIATDQVNYDTMVEIIDPSIGKLLVSQRLPWVGGIFLDDGRISAYRADPDGIISVDVLRPILSRR